MNSPLNGARTLFILCKVCCHPDATIYNSQTAVQLVQHKSIKMHVDSCIHLNTDQCNFFLPSLLIDQMLNSKLCTNWRYSSSKLVQV